MSNYTSNRVVLERLKERSLGTGIIDLSRLEYFRASDPHYFSSRLYRSKLKRLKKLFKRQCKPWLSANRIPVEITKGEWDSYSKGPLKLMPDGMLYPYIQPHSGRLVRYMHGLARIEAAREFGQRWWVADFYYDLDQCCIERFQGMYSIKVTGPGEALRWIFHYASREEEVSWSDFQVHLTASQIADLRLIMKRTRLVKAFASLFHFGPLWQDLTAGVLATLRKNRCEEEAINYLARVRMQFHKITLGSKPSVVESLNTVTVQQVESRAPSVSSSDREHIFHKFDKREIFQSLADNEDRGRVKQEIEKQGLILTLNTFRLDMHILDRIHASLVNCLGEMEPADTLRQKIQDLFRSHFYITPAHDNGMPQDLDTQFSNLARRCYEHLFLHMLRKSCLKEGCLKGGCMKVEITLDQLQALAHKALNTTFPHCFGSFGGGATPMPDEIEMQCPPELMKAPQKRTDSKIPLNKRLGIKLFKPGTDGNDFLYLHHMEARDELQGEGRHASQYFLQKEVVTALLFGVDTDSGPQLFPTQSVTAAMPAMATYYSPFLNPARLQGVDMTTNEGAGYHPEAEDDSQGRMLDFQSRSLQSRCGSIPEGAQEATNPSLHGQRFSPTLSQDTAMGSIEEVRSWPRSRDESSASTAYFQPGQPRISRRPSLAVGRDVTDVSLFNQPLAQSVSQTSSADLQDISSLYPEHWQRSPKRLRPDITVSTLRNGKRLRVSPPRRQELSTLQASSFFPDRRAGLHCTSESISAHSELPSSGLNTWGTGQSIMQTPLREVRHNDGQSREELKDLNSRPHPSPTQDRVPLSSPIEETYTTGNSSSYSTRPSSPISERYMSGPCLNTGDLVENYAKLVSSVRASFIQGSVPASPSDETGSGMGRYPSGFQHAPEASVESSRQQEMNNFIDLTQTSGHRNGIETANTRFDRPETPQAGPLGSKEHSIQHLTTPISRDEIRFVSELSQEYYYVPRREDLVNAFVYNQKSTDINSTFSYIHLETKTKKVPLPDDVWTVIEKHSLSTIYVDSEHLASIELPQALPSRTLRLNRPNRQRGQQALFSPLFRSDGRSAADAARTFLRSFLVIG